jgi:hypothetical protein
MKMITKDERIVFIAKPADSRNMKDIKDVTGETTTVLLRRLLRDEIGRIRQQEALSKIYSYSHK